MEVRLNRALEEVERLKTQLNKMKQMNKVGAALLYHQVQFFVLLLVIKVILIIIPCITQMVGCD